MSRCLSHGADARTLSASARRIETPTTSICFFLNWYLGLWLQLTNTKVTAIEISRLKIALLGVAQSEYHILLLNEPLTP